MNELDVIIEAVENNIKEGEDLKELWAVPIGLKPIVKLDGSLLYGSNKLNDKFIKALGKQSRSKGVVKEIEKLLKRKKVNICFFTKSLIGFIAWRIFIPSYIKSIRGFYDPVKTKRIYILLSNNTNIFTYASDSFMSQLIVHELMHMASHETTKFISTFKPELCLYYRFLFKRLFSLTDEFDDKKAEQIMLFIYKTFEKGKGKLNNSLLVKYYKFLEKSLKPYSTMDDNDFDRKLLDFITLIKLYIKNIEAFFNSLRVFRHILIPMYDAYKDAFGMKNLQTICIQELIYPSEVIAIYSEKGSLSKVNKIIKAL